MKGQDPGVDGTRRARSWRDEVPTIADDVDIPVGGGLWRPLLGAGVFWWVSVLLTVVVVGGWFLVSDQTIRAHREYRPVSRTMQQITETGGAYLWVFGLVLMSMVWMAELGRRGRMHASRRSRSKGLPKGSNTVEVRPLGSGAHALWVVGLALLTFYLLSVAFDPHWFGSDDGSTLWILAGVVTSFATGVLLGSWVKKAVWAARVRRGTQTPQRPSAFWRWLTYRWRFELWGTGAGMMCVAIGLACARLGTADPEYRSSDDEFYALMGWSMVGVGVALLAIGLVCATQFWRAGEDLASAESVS